MENFVKLVKFRRRNLRRVQEHQRRLVQLQRRAHANPTILVLNALNGQMNVLEKEFMADGTVNPRTGAAIYSNDRIYQELVGEFGVPSSNRGPRKSVAGRTIFPNYVAKPKKEKMSPNSLHKLRSENAKRNFGSHIAQKGDNQLVSRRIGYNVFTNKVPNIKRNMEKKLVIFS